MIDLTLLADGGMGWLDASGPASHLVLSTRIRLARNLAAYPFVGRNSDRERETILDALRNRRSQASGRGTEADTSSGDEHELPISGYDGLKEKEIADQLS